MKYLKTHESFIQEGLFDIFEKFPDFKDTKLVNFEITISSKHGYSVPHIKYKNDDNYYVAINITDWNLTFSIPNGGENWYDFDQKEIKNKKNIEKLFNKIYNDIFNDISNMGKYLDDYMKIFEEHKKYFKFDLIYKFHDGLENSLRYQQYLLDKGDIISLSKLNKLHPEIESKMKTIKKLDDWS